MEKRAGSHGSSLDVSEPARMIGRPREGKLDLAHFCVMTGQLLDETGSSGMASARAGAVWNL